MAFNNYSDSDDSSSDMDNFIPTGISGINLDKIKLTTPSIGSVMVKKQQGDALGLIPQVQYFTLLNKAYNGTLKNLQKDKSKPFKLKLVVQRKNRKTQINLQEVATQLNRQIEHLKYFILSSLSKDGTLTEQGLLLINERFVQSEIETVIVSFIKQFVICKSCESVDETRIIKENRLFFIQCDKCHSRRCLGQNIDGYNYKEEMKIKYKEAEE